MSGTLSASGMAGPWPCRRAWAAILVVVAAGTSARSQDFDDPEPAPAAVQDGFDLSESNFEAWIYGNTAGRKGGPDRLTSILAITMNDVDRACKLSDAQKKKLSLAAQGDVKHFQDRVAGARRVFEQYRRDQARMNEIHQETMPLAALLRDGLFADGSFFAKTLRTTLDPDQAARYRESHRQRDQFRYRAKIELTLHTLDDSVGLTAEQHEQLVELILGSTTVPTKWPSSQQDRSLVLVKMGQIPEGKIRPLLDDARWLALKRQLAQARRMEPFLRSQGFLDAAEPARTKND